MRTLMLTLVLAAALIGAVCAWLLTAHKPVPVDPAWAVKGGQTATEDAVTVRFTGTSTLLFSDGETHWMVDGWFSRPGPLRVALGQIAPDLDAIERGLASNKAERLAAVIPVHSHYDHAMDAPEVARRTGALLLGSEATANIGRGWGLAEDRIRLLADRTPVAVGEFVITPIESRHFQFADPAMRVRALGDPDIDAPLVPPVSAFDYRLGKTYVLHVTHPKGSFAVVGSAGYVDGGLEGYRADVVFLGVGGLGSQTEDYRREYWRETVGRLQPHTVVPIHYDSLTGPIEGEFRGPVMLMGFLSSGLENTLLFLKAREAEAPGLRFMTLPRYDEVVLFK